LLTLRHNNKHSRSLSPSLHSSSSPSSNNRQKTNPKLFNTKTKKKMTTSTTMRDVCIIAAMTLVALTAVQAGHPEQPIDLGTAGDFVIVTKSGVTTTGATHITGDVGTSPIAATGELLITTCSVPLSCYYLLFTTLLLTTTTTTTTSTTTASTTTPTATTAMTGFGLVLDSTTQFSTSSLVAGKLFMLPRTASPLRPR
jgi:hypothetical protein